MTHHQMEQLLAACKHYMPMEMRGKIMAELPYAYNAWMGGDYVKVVAVSSGRDVPDRTLS